jgi:hypothetical protein|nr:MAG TPA: hypothetical protein [Caudoviricetes sp.]
MKLKLKNTKIIEDITDENDEVIGKVSFDPKDARAYKVFLNLINLIEDYQKKDKKIGDIEDLPTGEIKSIEDIEIYKDSFDKLETKIDNYLELETEIKKITDEVFGNVSETFSKVSNSIEPYIELVQWATPYFKKERSEKVNTYLSKKEDVL